MLRALKNKLALKKAPLLINFPTGGRRMWKKSEYNLTSKSRKCERWNGKGRNKAVHPERAREYMS